MGWRIPRRWWSPALIGLLLIGGEPSTGQGPTRIVQPQPSSYFDPKLEPIRRASASWDARPGPERAVVDQICLVPDLATFFQAVSTWDRGHFFPVLFDDVESSFRFIRAFKPARVVRMPKASHQPTPSQTWDHAITAVGASWAPEAAREPRGLRGDLVPKDLGPTPPGVVLSGPRAPMLAGAVALAAGRFQPLLRLESTAQFADVLSVDQVTAFEQEVVDKVKGSAANYDQLGDECDFLTVAGDLPYRYRDAQGDLEAVDDRIGRLAGSDNRWAFAGRLLGDAVQSTYRAMCSLFLQPESALMFNGYDESAVPWSLYSMRTASLRLTSAVPTSQVSGESQANLEGWHETFDPGNRFGLVLINSHGSPTEFNLRGGPAHAPDIPRSVPAAILMIHSFSSADPNDPATVAGRWLANGAFVFFGSMNEPFLDAFRTPRLAGDLIARRLPLVVAARQTIAESRGLPWRLVFLGDPLYRLKPRPALNATARLDRWEPTSRWPAYLETRRPAGANDADLFLWALKTAVARLQGAASTPADDLVEAVLGVHRQALPAGYRAIYDALAIEILLEARKRTALRGLLAAVPEDERSPTARRALETMLAADFFLALAQKDASKVHAAWLGLIKAAAPPEFQKQATARAGRLADSPAAREGWRKTLEAGLRDRPSPPVAEVIVAELKRVDAGR